jgi:hypothetical protein
MWAPLNAVESPAMALFHRRRRSISTEAIRGQAAVVADAVPRAKMTHSGSPTLTLK